jgi:hypothetical protein
VLAVTEKLEHAPGSAPSRGPRKLIFETGAPESRCVIPPALDVPEIDLGSALGGALRAEVPPLLPHVTEVEIARHYAISPR